MNDTGAPARVGIFYHSDPAGYVPSGVDSFIRGILQFAPADIEYTLYGATSDPATKAAIGNPRGTSAETGAATMNQPARHSPVGFIVPDSHATRTRPPPA